MLKDKEIQKGQKIVTALYLVSGHLSKEEPLQFKLRSKGLDLLSSLTATTNLRPSASDLRPSAFIEEIVSLLEIANVVGLISQMNVEILKRELENLSQTLNKEHSLPAAGSELLSFLGEKNQQPTTPSADGVRLRSDQQPTLKISNKEKAYSANTNKNFPRKSASSPRSSARSAGPNTCPFPDRKEAILNAINDKKEATINDIKATINDTPQCADISPRTLQRDLMALVREGTLEKRGEKRWSTYTLNSR